MVNKCVTTSCCHVKAIGKRKEEVSKGRRPQRAAINFDFDAPSSNWSSTYSGKSSPAGVEVIPTRDNEMN